MEKGIELIKDGGKFSFIIPNTWTSLESFYEIRKCILDNCRIIRLVQLPKKVFQDATVETCIFVLSKENDIKKREKNIVKVERLKETGETFQIKEFNQYEIYKNHLYNFQLYSEQEGNSILNKIKKVGLRLGDFVEFYYGLKTGDDDKFISDEAKNKDYMKLVRSKDVSRYQINFENKYAWYAPDLMVKNKPTARPGDKSRFESEKIVVARMGKQVVATYDKDHFYVKDGMLLLKKADSINLAYITGLLNSKVINYYYKNYFITIDVMKNALLELPIVPNKKYEEKIISFVNQIINLNKQLLAIKGKQTDSKVQLEKEIQKLDNEIDEEVYKLYGITEDEKKIIEESLK